MPQPTTTQVPADKPQEATGDPTRKGMHDAPKANQKGGTNPPLELNATLPFVHQFEIESPLTEEPQLVKVDYEWKPPRCERCQCFGHNCVAKEEQILKHNNNDEKKQVDQPEKVVKETFVRGNGDQETKTGEKEKDKKEDDTTSSPSPQASTSTKLPTGPCAQAKCKVPEVSQEESCSSDKAATELTGKGKWPLDDEDITSKSKGKALAISEPIPPQSPVKPRVVPSNTAMVEKGLGLSDWSFFSNGQQRPLCRIMLGWNTKLIEVNILSSGGQWITCDTANIAGGQKLRVTFVYGSSTPTDRQELWYYLQYQNSINGSQPWLVSGDFNAIMRVSDRQGGDSNWYRYMDDFPNCVHQSELIQLAANGIHFTWHNRQQGQASILRKLDWAFEHDK
ncbi:hypothetical protein OIU79_007620 [Salix purpurea]|uniref:Uncharacterized protein n=1 Tax=Salix purpurea TaxID=77065 RepID=A0A9Q0TGG4_SALPP|nr:hypothetical protein OIU79_007620 [Salix purpurea]